MSERLIHLTRVPLELLPSDAQSDDGSTFLASRRALLAKRIRLRMIELNIRSQRELMRRTRLARGTIDRVLNGRPSSPATYERVAEVLDTTVAELLATPQEDQQRQLADEMYDVALAFERASTEVRHRVRRLLFGIDAELKLFGEQVYEATKESQADSTPKPRSKRQRA